LGWSDGRNVRIDIRWGTNDIDRQRGYAAELAALIPDVILARGTLSVVALQHVTRTLPIVFVRVVDPVGAGFVDNLARPGGAEIWCNRSRLVDRGHRWHNRGSGGQWGASICCL
jgi:putative tryptophan/tyrosine transport system substrate-binding protein